MLLLELFCGTKSVGNVARELGFKTISLDINPHFKPDIARAATRNMLIRVRDGTRESDTHTYLTNASLGP